MTKWAFKWVCLVAGVVIALSANAAPISVTDSAGRTVTIPKPAERIIALAPHIVENIFSAGAGKKLVGVVSYSDFPEQAKSLPIVGGYHAFSLEKIIALRPDLIVTWAEGDGSTAAKPFEQLGIPVYVDEPRQLTEVASSVRKLGQLSGTDDIANRIADQYLSALATLRKRYSDAEPVTVFYQVWNKPLQTINGDHIIDAVIKLCGGKNIFSGVPVIAPKVSLESVITQNPQAVVASGMDEARPEWLDDWRVYPGMKAVANNDLYFIPPDILQRHTLRILQGADLMCKSLEQVRRKKSTLNYPE